MARPGRRGFGKQGSSRRDRAPRPAPTRRAHAHSTPWDPCICPRLHRPSRSRRTISRTRPTSGCPRGACIPCSRCPELIVAPVAWMWPAICTLQQGYCKICGRNLHNRLPLILGHLRQLDRGLLFCVGCCSLVSPHSTPSPRRDPSAPYSRL